MTDTTSHQYDGHDPGGLESLSMDMPVLDASARETAQMPVLISKPPEWWCEEKGYETGDPKIGFGQPCYQHRVPRNRVEDVQADVIDQFYDDFEAHVNSIDPDELESGDAVIVGHAELVFKRIEGWRLSRYTLETCEPDWDTFEDKPE